MFRLAIVIINYRTPDLTCNCLESLEGQIDIEQDSVIVIDNASGDGSDKKIEEFISKRGWTQWIEVEKSANNEGFSGGNNRGIKRITAKYYLLLNSDTIVRPDAINQLLNAGETFKTAGIISPRLEWPDGAPQISCFRQKKPSDEFFSSARTKIVDMIFHYPGEIFDITDVPMQPYWTSFACVLIRREVFNKIGLLDAGYFMYFDDMDFCTRAWKENIPVLHWPAARVVHLRGGSGKVKKKTAERRRLPRYWYESRNRYYAKFYGVTGLWITNVFWYAGRLISLAREKLKLKEPHTSDQQWKDIWINAMNPVLPRH